MKISPTNKDSLGDCAELYAVVFNQVPWSENWSFEQAMDRLFFYYETPNFLGICIHDGSNLLGFVLGNYEPYQNEKLYILKEMCVRPEYQGSGIGKQLITYLHDELIRNNVSTVNLITQINGKAESFYLKNGYYKSQRMGLYVARLNT